MNNNKDNQDNQNNNNNNSSKTQVNPKSLFKIMIATDNHVGYLENDQIRGDDAFNAVEEILIKAKELKVDFLLMGGDLFHHHNPSKKTIIRISNILQKHIFGQKKHEFDTYCYQANYFNDNYSVELPIFIIHGNHDDPSGLDNFSSIDIFGNKEVNYFGKVNNYEEFDLYPILFEKGETKLAIYGIGNIKDERLYLALQNKKVNFNRPDNHKDWFNILVVHQNRFKGHYTNKNKKNYLPETFIPSFFDLVVWGHEHECFTQPVYNSEVGFHVYQPGSSVATSLIAAEAKSKHVGVLELYKSSFRVIPIKLETVRPFIHNQFELKSFNNRIKNSDDIEILITEKIEEALQDAKKQYPNSKLLPLIRLKIETSGYIISRTNIIISKFANMIANPHDVLQFYKKPDPITNKFSSGNVNGNGEFDMFDNKSTTANLEDDIVDQYDELKKFISGNVINKMSESNTNLMHPDVFLDSIEKYTNGQDKKSIEFLTNNFYTKLSQQSNNSINWKYVEDYKLEDNIISRKENYKNIDKLFDGCDNFVFNNDRNGDISMDIDNNTSNNNNNNNNNNSNNNKGHKKNKSSNNNLNTTINFANKNMNNVDKSDILDLEMDNKKYKNKMNIDNNNSSNNHNMKYFNYDNNKDKNIANDFNSIDINKNNSDFSNSNINNNNKNNNSNNNLNKMNNEIGNHLKRKNNNDKNNKNKYKVKGGYK